MNLLDKIVISLLSSNKKTEIVNATVSLESIYNKLGILDIYFFNPVTKLLVVLLTIGPPSPIKYTYSLQALTF